MGRRVGFALSLCLSVSLCVSKPRRLVVILYFLPLVLQARTSAYVSIRRLLLLHYCSVKSGGGYGTATLEYRSAPFGRVGAAEMSAVVYGTVSVARYLL